MESNKITVDLSNLDLSTEDQQNIQSTVSDAAAAAVEDIITNVVRINIVFCNGVGHLNASQMRDGDTIAEGELDQSGAIFLKTGIKDDVITIDGACTGTAEVTINVGTARTTPVTYTDGIIGERFDLI